MGKSASAAVAIALCSLLGASALTAPAPAPARSQALASALSPLSAPAVAPAPTATHLVHSSSAAASPAPAAPKTVSVDRTRSYQGRGPPPNCIAKAQGAVANNAACSPIVNYLKPYGDSLTGASDDHIRQITAGMPKPDEECCWDLRDFIDSACACDNRLISLLPLVHLNQGVLSTAVRAIQNSACAAQQYGGAIYDPCTDTTGPVYNGGGAAGRRLLAN